MRERPCVIYWTREGKRAWRFRSVVKLPSSLPGLFGLFVDWVFFRFSCTSYSHSLYNFSFSSFSYSVFYVEKWQLYHRKWSEAAQSLQHAIRGYPACADLWEVVLSVLKLSSLFLFNLDESELIGSYIWCIFRVWVLPTSDWECLLLQLRYLFSFLLVT